MSHDRGEPTAPAHCVRYEVDAGVATVTLDRPERANAWTGRMEVEYRHALVRADRDPGVGAIVLTGAGRQFCVGADQRALAGSVDAGSYQSGIHEPLPEPGDPSHPAYGTRHGFLLAVSKPVIAAVNGAAAGVGFVVMCFADIRFAAADAKLTTSTARLGLPAEYGLAWILPRLIGAARAAPLLLASPVITGQEAAAMGLVHEATASGETLAHAQAYARRLVGENAPSSLRVIKRQLWDGLVSSLGDADATAGELLLTMATSDDFRQGVDALRERRPPDFTDRYR